MTSPGTDAAALGAIIARTRWLLLDFDGPICSIYSGLPAPTVAEKLRTLQRELDSQKAKGNVPNAAKAQAEAHFSRFLKPSSRRASPRKSGAWPWGCSDWG